MTRGTEIKKEKLSGKTKLEGKDYEMEKFVITVKQEGTKDSTVYKFKIDTDQDTMRWIHAFLLILESHQYLLYDPKIQITNCGDMIHLKKSEVAQKPGQKGRAKKSQPSIQFS